MNNTIPALLTVPANLGEVDWFDGFCGAGGSANGLEFVPGFRVKCAVNHWELAVEAHNANFPHADHDVHDIEQIHPRRFKRTRCAWFSPECFQAGTLITTQRGQVSIEKVKVGDYVLTHKNRWRMVVRTQSRTVDNAVTLIGQGLSSGLKTTANHRLWALKDRQQQVDWIEAENMVGSYWSTPTEVKDGLPVIIPDQLTKCSEETAWWIVGRWLGDGSLTFGRNYEVTISCSYEEKDELGARLAETELNWRVHRKRTAVNFTLWSPHLRDWLYDTFGHGAAYKNLPGWVLDLPREYRQALLDGYVAADGHVSSRQTEITTVSKALAIGTRLLAESLGYRADVYTYQQHSLEIEGREIQGRDLWRMKWENDLQRQYAFESNGLAHSKVKDLIKHEGEIEVYNIEVEEDHSYVADGIVVANCTHHTRARGKQETDDEVVRSRMTMMDVIRYSEYHRYDAVIVENVMAEGHGILITHP